MKLIAPSPDVPDQTKINDVLLPFRIATILNRAGFRTVGEIRKASDSELLRQPRISHIGVAYLRRTLGGGTQGCVRHSAVTPAPTSIGSMLTKHVAAMALVRVLKPTDMRSLICRKSQPSGAWGRRFRKRLAFDVQYYHTASVTGPGPVASTGG
jgi:hypothetical protein